MYKGSVGLGFQAEGFICRLSLWGPMLKENGDFQGSGFRA